jgi:hypothetical protein
MCDLDDAGDLIEARDEADPAACYEHLSLLTEIINA